MCRMIFPMVGTSSFVSMVRVFGIWIGICPGELELLYVTSY